jgi:hypothetical protein
MYNTRGCIVCTFVPWVHRIWCYQTDALTNYTKETYRSHNPWGYQYGTIKVVSRSIYRAAVLIQISDDRDSILFWSTLGALKRNSDGDKFLFWWDLGCTEGGGSGLNKSYQFQVEINLLTGHRIISSLWIIYLPGITVTFIHSFIHSFHTTHSRARTSLNFIRNMASKGPKRCVWFRYRIHNTVNIHLLRCSW